MGDMKKAYEVAAIAVRQRLAEQRPEDLQVLNKLRKQDVAVYAGSFDRVEDILACLNVSCTMNPDASKLDAQIIFVNCSSGYDKTLIQHLSQQVNEGKWLVSSDWALGRFIEPAFPGMVKFTGRATGDEVISVEPSLNSLWSDVVVLGADPQWWLEGSSHPIEVLSPDKVAIEAASHDLLSRHSAPVVAASFDWGRGHVFHVISHFWCKRSRTPTQRHQGPCTDFLKAGMKLSDESIDKVLAIAQIKADTFNFAQLQSAVTSTELIAQLCIRAARAVPAKPRPRIFPW
ncbi:hypothetical protein [Leptolyngbya sp. FACHB-16]|uniref:hypothetical protein n=1 Tax=unclassified Leptolyngbya TaxID=2650499 RepID=UPI001683AC38|nr:hypothetical protein [Leptolyngbya sp. FACHB-16]MBD2156056.1 hypothetical protein [Leptolyngbya sp. FACHB-16]